MPSLFIANISNKNNEFLFTLPGVAQLRRVVIPAGRQAQVVKDLNRDEIDYIIDQHKVYGLTEQTQVKRIDSFAGTLYSIDKPVTVDNMQIAIDINNDILVKEGYELRKLAAVAIDAKFTEFVEDSRGNAPKPLSTQIEVEEIPSPDDRNDKRKLIKQKIRVSTDVNPEKN